MKDKKTLFIQHRVNSIDELKEVSHHYGVETDIRIYKDKIILNHEPFEDGVSFDSFLEHYNHKFLIINTKCDGAEKQILEKLEEKSIKDFFFLDSSIPTTINLVESGIRNIATRYSKYEPIEFAMKYNLVGYDIDLLRINELNNGLDKTNEADLEKLNKVLKSSKTTGLYFSNNEKDLKDCNIFIVTVPTPINKFKSPDLTQLLKASKSF